MKTIALIAAVLLAGCDADAPAPAASSFAQADAAALTAHRLRINALPAMRLLATSDGRELLATAVSCALPLGASLTAIAGDGTPYSFTGSSGLAPAWLSHTPSASERRLLAACVHGVGTPATGEQRPLVGTLRTLPARTGS